MCNLLLDTKTLSIDTILIFIQKISCGNSRLVLEKAHQMVWFGKVELKRNLPNGNDGLDSVILDGNK